MSQDFFDYNVLGIVNRNGLRCSYRVEEKQTGRLYVWEAVDYGVLSGNDKKALIAEIRMLQELTHPNLVRCISSVNHKATGTLYLVKEYFGGNVSALINKCRTTNSFVDESFVWKILYYTARGAQAKYAKGTPSMHLDLSTHGVNLDDDGNVKLNYWIEFKGLFVDPQAIDKDVTSECKRKKTDTLSLGRLILELTTLQRPHLSSYKQVKLPNQYSDELHKIISIMLNDYEKRPTIESILYHPLLVSHVVLNSLQQVSVTGNNETSSLNSDNGSEACSRCKTIEPKLIAMRKKESNLKNFEHELKQRELNVMQKEKHVALMEQLVKEKMLRADVYLNSSRKERRCVTTDRMSIRNGPVDLDSSSYSADPGDTSILPTAAKIDPSRILRPPSLAPSMSSRRSVRFETIPEFDEPCTNKELEQKAWLKNKRDRYKAKKLKCKDKSECREKENKVPERRVKNTQNDLLNFNTKETQNGILETFFR